jgi:hypothetical protein
MMPALFWGLIWRSIPISRGAESLALNSGKMLWRNSVYFLQGPAYPITWLGGLISERLAIDNTLVAVGLTAIALAGAALVQWRTAADRRAWLPWLWIGLTSAPAVLFLDYAYVSSSPRMMMLMSVGAVWLWTDVAVCLLDWGRVTLTRRRFNYALVGGLVMALMIQNVAFVRNRLRPWELSGAVIRQIVGWTSLANAQGQQAVFINLPAWIASTQAGFAIGLNGAGILSTYYPLEDIVRSYTNQASQAASLRNDAIRTEVPTYYVGLRNSTTDWQALTQAGGQIFITTYAADEINIRPAGALKVDTPGNKPLAQFGSAVLLNSATAIQTPAGLKVELAWQVAEPPPDDVTIFVHVLDNQGQLIAQADGDPIAGCYPLAQWPKNFAARDVRWVDAPVGASVRIGLYNRATGERLAAVAATGENLPDNAVSISIQRQVP